MLRAPEPAESAMNQKAAPSLDYASAATRWFARRSGGVDHALHEVIRRATEREVMAEDPNRKLDEQSTFGGRLADRVASFGGSWMFISLFGIALAAWALLNTEILGKTAFDPYPFIFLNLMLSMLAAVQAPIILMSQNRQAAKDRLMAAHDYQINLKAEVEIMALHEKMDLLRSEQLATLIEQQQRHLEMLTKLALAKPVGGTE
jgi:uncharacterized membrane protein